MREWNLLENTYAKVTHRSQTASEELLAIVSCPVTAPLTVTAVVPEEIKVTVCVVGVFTATLPKERLDALRLRAGVAAFNPAFRR